MTQLDQDVTTLETAMRSLMRTMKRPQTWAVLTERAGITIDRPGAAILRILVHTPEQTKCRLHELAEILGVEAPTITRKTQQLETLGLLYRERDEQDGRAYSLKVTEKGRVIARKIDTAQNQILEATLVGWDADDRQRFIGLFQRFSDDLSQQYQQTSTTKRS